MKKIEAILFDMDGVIFDTENAYFDIWTQVFREFGYKMTKEIYISVMGTGRKNVIRTFLDEYGGDLPVIEMYKEKDRRLEEAIRTDKVLMKEGVIEILRFLKESGCAIALATSAKRDRVMHQLKNANIEKEFDVIISGDEVENSKPDPEIFLRAAQKLGVKPENCIVIEDSPAGIRAAYNAKMVGMHVEDLKEADENILKYSHGSFKDLFEIKKYLSKFIIVEIGKLKSIM